MLFFFHFRAWIQTFQTFWIDNNFWGKGRKIIILKWDYIMATFEIITSVGYEINLELGSGKRRSSWYTHQISVTDKLRRRRYKSSFLCKQQINQIFSTSKTRRGLVEPPENISRVGQTDAELTPIRTRSRELESVSNFSISRPAQPNVQQCCWHECIAARAFFLPSLINKKLANLF